MLFIPNIAIQLMSSLMFLNLVHQSLQLTECQFLNNSSNPCVHGICLATNETQDLNYQCYCFNGFTGINCTKKFDQCLQLNPCQNNALCVSLEDVQDVRCVCPPGFCGKYCELEINECLSNPCKNHGICIDKVSGYECQCINGFKGKNCEIDVNVCSAVNSTQIVGNTSSLCFNGGTCVEGPGDKYFCACDPGHTGQRCEYKIRHCDSNPCLNGGRCQERQFQYDCTCSLEWTGKRCEIGLIECSINLCQNNAICMQTNASKAEVKPQNSQILCYCLPDFYGPKCEHKYNDCTSNPCLNGLCIDGIDSYNCSCSQGFVGINCQIDCSDPLNEQICMNSVVNPWSSLVSIGLSTTSFVMITSVPIESSLESSLQMESSIYSSMYSSMYSSIYSSIDSSMSYWPSIDVMPSGTPYLNSSVILESILETTFVTPLPLITISPTVLKPETSPTIEPNVSLPTNPIASSEAKVFIPRFNGFNSSIIYRSKRTKRDYLSIGMSLKSDDNSTESIVPVLYSKSRGNHELLIYIKNNSLKLLIIKGLKQILIIETKYKITAKVFNKIEIKLWFTSSNKRLNFLIQFNETEKTGGYKEIDTIDSQGLCSFQLYYFGDIGTNFNRLLLIENKNQSNLFLGCIQNIIINKYELFLSDAIKVTDISECITNFEDICQQKPCRNGGNCQTDGFNWNCVCPVGYAGDLCETAFCSEGICRNDGVCILPDERNYLCVCPHGWTGLHCEQETKPIFASFNLDPNKQSFIRYKLKDLSNHLEIKFKFATNNMNQSKALILFMSNEQKLAKNQSFIIDFMSITLDSGILLFRINLGHGTKTLWTPIDQTLTEQLVFFGHHNQFVWLVVVPEDKHKIKPIISKTPLSFKALNVSPILYVGGHDTYKSHPFLRSHTGFKGCIYDIQIRTKLDFDFEILSNDSINTSVNIGICHLLDDCSRA